MRNLLVAVLTGSALAAGMAAAAAPPPGPPADLQARVDAYLAPFVQDRNFSGTVLIARQGVVLVSKGYGLANYELGVPNTPRTRFHIASVSKPFTAAAILILQQKGRLKTSDPVSRYVDGFPGGDGITLEHLLTHTSGIPNVNDFPEYEQESRRPHTPLDLIALFKDKPRTSRQASATATATPTTTSWATSSRRFRAWSTGRSSGKTSSGRSAWTRPATTVERARSSRTVRPATRLLESATWRTRPTWIGA